MFQIGDQATYHDVSKIPNWLWVFLLKFSFNIHDFLIVNQLCAT